MKQGALRVCAALLAAMVLSPMASGQQRDPFNGQFGAIERAMAPDEAAAQIEMMADALSGLAPQRPGVTDTYILSAGLWNDPVFEREAEQAADLLGRRFDAADRTIILSAGQAGAPRKYPAATPNNIHAALGKIGSVIDPNEDLVVVFLTSHGGQDGAMGLQELNRMGGALRAHHLRSALASAGIRNKVVIISSCFSGHFILPFSDPNSIILTAAAADKTSFGCQPEREWTYFGDALLNRSLRSGAPLVEAFDESLGLISQWEQELMAEWDAKPAAARGGLPRPEPSNPQKHIGAAVSLMLPLAEHYGMIVECAGTLGVAYDRARTRRPLEGLSDASTIERAREQSREEAARLGAAVTRSDEDVARAISQARLAATAVVNDDADVLAEHGARCAADLGG